MRYYPVNSKVLFIADKTSLDTFNYTYIWEIEIDKLRTQTLYGYKVYFEFTSYGIKNINLTVIDNRTGLQSTYSDKLYISYPSFTPAGGPPPPIEGYTYTLLGPTVNTFAGYLWNSSNGNTGEGLLGTNRLNVPAGMVIKDSYLYVLENDRIHKIDPSGNSVLYTVDPQKYNSYNTSYIGPVFDTIVDTYGNDLRMGPDNNLYFTADQYVYKISSQIVPIPTKIGVTIDSSNSLTQVNNYCYDSVTNAIYGDKNGCIIKIDITTGIPSVFSGSYSEMGYVDGSSTDARFYNIHCQTIYDGYIYISEDAQTGNYSNRIRKINIVDGSVITIGTFNSNQYQVSLLAINPATGDIYSTQGYFIYKTTPTGITTVVVGNYVNPWYSIDGTGTSARVNSVAGMAFDSTGTNLYITESQNNVIRKIRISDYLVTTVCGMLPGNSNGVAADIDDFGAFARLANPYSIFRGSDSAFYIHDDGFFKIKVFNPNNNSITTFFKIKPYITMIGAANATTIYCTDTRINNALDLMSYSPGVTDVISYYCGRPADKLFSYYTFPNSPLYEYDKYESKDGVINYPVCLVSIPTAPLTLSFSSNDNTTYPPFPYAGSNQLSFVYTWVDINDIETDIGLGTGTWFTNQTNFSTNYPSPNMYPKTILLTIPTLPANVKGLKLYVKISNSIWFNILDPRLSNNPNPGDVLEIIFNQNSSSTNSLIANNLAKNYLESTITKLAGFNQLCTLTWDSDGNMFLPDSNLLRKIDTSGIVTTPFGKKGSQVNIFNSIEGYGNNVEPACGAPGIYSVAFIPNAYEDFGHYASNPPAGTNAIFKYVITQLDINGLESVGCFATEINYALLGQAYATIGQLSLGNPTPTDVFIVPSYGQYNGSTCFAIKSSTSQVYYVASNGYCNLIGTDTSQGNIIDFFNDSSFYYALTDTGKFSVYNSFPSNPANKLTTKTGLTNATKFIKIYGSTPTIYIMSSTTIWRLTAASFNGLSSATPIVVYTADSGKTITGIGQSNAANTSIYFSTASAVYILNDTTATLVAGDPDNHGYVDATGTAARFGNIIDLSTMWGGPADFTKIMVIESDTKYLRQITINTYVVTLFSLNINSNRLYMYHLITTGNQSLFLDKTSTLNVVAHLIDNLSSASIPQRLITLPTPTTGAVYFKVYLKITFGTQSTNYRVVGFVPVTETSLNDGANFISYYGANHMADTPSESAFYKTWGSARLPNNVEGIAFDTNHQNLFFAEYGAGVYKIDMSIGKSSLVIPPSVGTYTDLNNSFAITDSFSELPSSLVVTNLDETTSEWMFYTYKSKLAICAIDSRGVATSPVITDEFPISNLVKQIIIPVLPIGAASLQIFYGLYNNEWKWYPFVVPIVPGSTIKLSVASDFINISYTTSFLVSSSTANTQAWGLTWNSERNALWIADWGNNRILEYNPSTHYCLNIAGPGPITYWEQWTGLRDGESHDIGPRAGLDEPSYITKGFDANTYFISEWRGYRVLKIDMNNLTHNFTINPAAQTEPQLITLGITHSAILDTDLGSGINNNYPEIPRCRIRQFKYVLLAGEIIDIILKIISNSYLYIKDNWYTSEDSINYISTRTALDHSEYAYRYTNDSGYTQNLIVEIGADDGWPAQFDLEVSQNTAGIDISHPLVWGIQPFASYNMDGFRFRSSDGRLFMTLDTTVTSVDSNGLNPIVEATYPNNETWWADIDFAADGTPWLVDSWNSGKVYKIVAGIIEVVVDTGAYYFDNIVMHTDGNFYALGEDLDYKLAIYQITPAGVATKKYTGVLHGDYGGLASAPDGGIYFTENNALQKLMPNGSIITIITDKFNSAIAGGTLAEACICTVTDITVDNNGIIYLVNRNFNKLSIIDIPNNLVTLSINIPNNYCYACRWHNGILYLASQAIGKYVQIN
jgi:hypothetical protein